MLRDGKEIAAAHSIFLLAGRVVLLTSTLNRIGKLRKGRVPKVGDERRSRAKECISVVVMGEPRIPSQICCDHERFHQAQAGSLARQPANGPPLASA